MTDIKSVAICYFGMTRSTRFVYESHRKHIFDTLVQNNIDYTVYMHTWETDTNMIWEERSSVPIDYNEYRLLNPHIYKIDNQSDFLNALDFSNYFNEDLYKVHGGDTHNEWRPGLIRNHLCALESQKRCYNLVLQEQDKKHDYIMFIRPDVWVENNIDLNFVSKKFDIVIPNNDHYEGYNDRFAILPFETSNKYACRIDEIIDFRKTQGRIVSEKYVKYIIDKYYHNILLIDFRMTIIRPR